MSPELQHSRLPDRALGVSPSECDPARKYYFVLHYFAAGQLRSWGHLEALITKQKSPFASGKLDEWTLKGNIWKQLQRQTLVNVPSKKSLLLAFAQSPLLMSLSLSEMDPMSPSCVLNLHCSCGPPEGVGSVQGSGSSSYSSLCFRPSCHLILRRPYGPSFSQICL